MDKLNCAVVRDLMPLVVDDVASKESKEAVEKHMESCETCRAYYGGMTAQIGKMAVSPDTETSFIKFCRKMEKKLSSRKLLIGAIILIVVIALAIPGYVYYEHKTTVWMQDMPPENMDVTLYRDVDGVIALTITPKDGNRWFGQSSSCFENGIFYISPLMPEWPLWYLGFDKGAEYSWCFGLVWENGKINYIEDEYDVIYDKEAAAYVDSITTHRTPVKAIRWGTEDDYITLYTAGDPVPTFDQINK